MALMIDYNDIGSIFIDIFFSNYLDEDGRHIAVQSCPDYTTDKTANSLIYQGG